jgi:hypothetical protein
MRGRSRRALNRQYSRKVASQTSGLRPARPSVLLAHLDTDQSPCRSRGCSWQYTGGTGTFSGITGGGTYKGRITSPTEVQVNWDGTYQLG